MKKYIFLIFLIIITALIISYSFLLYGNPIKKAEYNKIFANYLSNKYLEPMKIKNIIYNFKQNYYFAIAFPENNNNLEFEVKDLKNGISDTYIQMKWKNEIEKQIKPFILNTIPNFKSIDITFIGMPLEYISKSEIPNYLDIQNLFNGNKSVTLNININKDLEDQKEEYEQIYKFINYLRQKQIYFTVIDLIFKEKKFTEVKIYNKDIDNIDSAKDISKYTKTTDILVH